MRNKGEQLSRYDPEGKRMIMNAHVQQLWFRNEEVLRHEALLDQAVHRDLILLLQLKKAASAALALSVKKPPSYDRELIEGEVANSDAS